MFSNLSEKIIVLVIILVTLYSISRMYENFIDVHKGRMSFPDSSLNSRNKHLNSLHLSTGWRNAYRIGGGCPTFRVPTRITGKMKALHKIPCNYPIKDEEAKYHPFFE